MISRVLTGLRVKYPQRHPTHSASASSSSSSSHLPGPVAFGLRISTFGLHFVTGWSRFVTGNVTGRKSANPCKHSFVTVSRVYTPESHPPSRSRPALHRLGVGGFRVRCSIFRSGPIRTTSFAPSSYRPGHPRANFGNLPVTCR